MLVQGVTKPEPKGFPAGLGSFVPHCSIPSLLLSIVLGTYLLLGYA